MYSIKRFSRLPEGVMSLDKAAEKKSIHKNAALVSIDGGWKLVKPEDIRQNQYSEREKVPSEILEKAKTDGVVQKDSDGKWRIINLKKGTYWTQVYKSKENAEAALRAYHSNK